MSARTSRIWSRAAVLVACLASGCAAHSTASDVRAVRTLVAERTHDALELPRQRNPDALDGDVQKLIAEPLTLQHAIQIALLNNRELRAELFGLGVARGQLVQAALFPNVDFDVAVRFPVQSEHARDWDLGAGIDLTQLILRGARSDVANAELAAARIRTAGAVLDLGYRVRLGYYDVQANTQSVELLRTAMQAYAASFDTARELQRVGNATELDVATEQTAYEGARVAVAEAEADLIDARERLNVLLGLFGRRIDWQPIARLPEPDAMNDPPETLEGRAIAASLELAETRSTLLASARRVGFTRLAGVLPDLSVGVSAEKHEGHWLVGPEVHGSLPLFDRQQGARISAQAQLDSLRERYVAQAIEIRAVLRAVRDRARSAEERVRRYQTTLLPLREHVVHESLLQYNAMQIGVFQLLQARRDQVDAGRNYVSTLHEYWRSRAALEQLLAGRMVDAEAAVTKMHAPQSMPIAASAQAGH